jgi:hypothetical protein
MGLDIYHAHAKREVDRRFCRVDPFIDEMQLLRPYIQRHESPSIDWERMFSARGLECKNYRLMVRTTDGKNTCFVFADVGTVGFNHPIRAVFSNEWKFPLLPKFMKQSKFRLPQSKNAPHFFGPFLTVMKSENVIFYDLVGYQRNSVSEEFYHYFRPDDVTCLEHRVEGIYQATAPELRENFKRNFINNWIDGRSFVIISY